MSDTEKKLIEGIDYYINEQGLLVFTAKYLLERGYCCGNGCKHCPFDLVTRISIIAIRNCDKQPPGTE